MYYRFESEVKIISDVPLPIFGEKRTLSDISEQIYHILKNNSTKFKDFNIYVQNNNHISQYEICKKIEKIIETELRICKIGNEQLTQIAAHVVND